MNTGLRHLLAALPLALAAFTAVPSYALNYEDYPVVRLRSLDKITARTMTFEAKVGSTIRFGEIFIKVQSCRKPPPVEATEAAAFLQIWQNNEVRETSKWIFSGWMFASSPALSAMSHPVYDVWVLDCIGRDPEQLPSPETTEGATPAPATDGDAPDAAPPSVEPDIAARVQAEDAATDGGPGTCQDDPGACEDAATVAPDVTTTPQSATPTPYVPEAADPSAYRDDAVEESNPSAPVSGESIPAEPASPQPSVPQPAAPQPAAPQPAAPQPAAPQPDKAQEFQGIY